MKQRNFLPAHYHSNFLDDSSIASSCYALKKQANPRYHTAPDYGYAYGLFWFGCRFSTTAMSALITKCLSKFLSIDQPKTHLLKFKQEIS